MDLISDQSPSVERSGLVDAYFHRHPRELGMSWGEHSRGAVVIGVTMIAAGTACLIHALVPGWFTETAGRTVRALNEQMNTRRATAVDPASWPEYEI